MTTVPVRGITIKAGKVKRVTKGSPTLRKAAHAKAARAARKWTAAGKRGAP